MADFYAGRRTGDCAAAVYGDLRFFRGSDLPGHLPIYMGPVQKQAAAPAPADTGGYRLLRVGVLHHHAERLHEHAAGIYAKERRDRRFSPARGDV
ncbi:hypothetical protein D3C76_1661700 [compost metagenome]